MRRPIGGGVIALAVLLLGAPLAAQTASESGLAVPPLTPVQEEEATAAMARLRSPFTASHTVDMCPSAGALRDSIRVEAAGGRRADEIVEGVLARHGEQLRIVPKRSGVGLLAWIATPLVLLVGGTLVTMRVRRGRADRERFPAPTVELSAGDRAQVAAALRSWEQGGEAEG